MKILSFILCLSIVCISLAEKMKEEFDQFKYTAYGVHGASFIAGGVFDKTYKIDKDNQKTFKIIEDKSFKLEFGVGCGWSGLDIIKISSSGEVEAYKQKGQGNWFSTKMTLCKSELKKIIDAIESNKLISRGKAYHRDVHDGMQWVFWFKQGKNEKSIYFNNAFPKFICNFAIDLDKVLRQNKFKELNWTTVPKEQARQHEKDIWNSIKPK